MVGPGKMKYMPYVNFYLDNIDRHEHEIHVAYWNRDEKDEDLSAFDGMYLHEYRKYMVNDAPLSVKLKCYYRFRKFCIKLIQRYEYDFVIVLHSIPGVILYDKLVKQYHGKYIFDYRDSTYEPRVQFFRRVVENLIRNSKVTFTSSDGFRKYFPEDSVVKVITSHNLLQDSLNYREFEKLASDKARISFWGFIRHAELNKVLIDRIGDDDRFELHYFGREQIDALTLKDYVLEKNYNNIFFHGEYRPEDRYEFVTRTDMIHNVYHDTNMLLAMGNKYYDGIIFRIPQICFPGSQMSKMCEAANVGVSLDPSDPDFCDKLYRYYKELQIENFNLACDAELERVMAEYRKGCEIIRSVVNHGK